MKNSNKILMLVLSLVCGNPAFAQEEPGADADTSKQVDESEENYRRRMELREQRFNEKPRVDTTYAPQISEGKLDALPPESREHVKQQMRDMIIESRQWQPGDELSGYPYEPSEAAKTDATLLQLEREAWAEQLQKYQEREAAAYANATGSQAGQGEQGQEGKEGQQGAEGQSGSTSSDSASQSADSSQRGKAAVSSQSEPGAQKEREAPEVSTAGVSESALSFLRGQGTQVGPASESAQDTGKEGQAGVEAAAANGAADQAESENEAEEEAVAADNLAGTLLIEELSQIEDTLPGTGSANGDAGSASSDETVNSSQQIEPGTVEIAELEKLRDHN